MAEQFDWLISVCFEYKYSNQCFEQHSQVLPMDYILASRDHSVIAFYM